MGWIKIISEDGVKNFEDLTPEELFDLRLDLLIEEEKQKEKFRKP